MVPTIGEIGKGLYPSAKVDTVEYRSRSMMTREQPPVKKGGIDRIHHALAGMAWKNGEGKVKFF